MLKLIDVENMVFSLTFCGRGQNEMIWGVGEIFCTPGVAQGGAHGAILACFGGANYSFEFCYFLVPISVS